jgi:hypothetical protein
MKIQKFNEEEPRKKSRLTPLCICMVMENKTVQYSGIFKNKKDMDNWLMNTVNEIILDRFEGEDDEEPGLVLTVEDAIDWLEDDFEVHYDTETITYNNIILKYGVDALISKNKFNI